MDVFDLVAKIRLDSSEYESGIGKAKGTFSNLATGVKNGLTTVAKVGGAAVAAGAAGVTALTKMGVEGYKQYEQLAGGAKLLWGEAYDIIAEKAQGAYATVQMSQSDYLTQVNGLAVGLKTALGGNAQAAAELAHNVVQAEADIVAATGATQENVQNAFNGIMKNNFSMVDNLGLGITATKEGFQTMIDSVNEYNAAHGKSTKYQIDNVADCQQALVDYVAMQGMAGYAGMEAAESLEGSLSMTKAAWQNLVTGMADPNANIGVLIDNMVTSAGAAAKQLIPAISRALSGIGEIITGLSPVIAQALPQLVSEVLPSLLTAGVSLITLLIGGVVSALPALYAALLDAVQLILVDVFGVSEQKAGEFTSGIKNAVQLLIDFLSAAWNAISAAFTWCVGQINTEGTVLNQIWENIKTFISSAVAVIENVIKLFTAVLQGDWTAAWEAVKNIVSSAWEAIQAAISTVLNIIKGVISTVWGGITSIISNGLETAKTTVFSILDSIKKKFTDIFDSAKKVVTEAIDTIKKVFDFEWSLPELKLPHVSVSGGEAPYGIGGKGTLPSFSVDWYAKAYNNAMVLRKPTIFGYSNGSFLGGGEGNGNEIVAGESHLMGMMGQVVASVTASQNEQIVGVLVDILDAITGGNEEMVRAVLADKKFAVGEREFARLVKTYA